MRFGVQIVKIGQDMQPESTAKKKRKKDKLRNVKSHAKTTDVDLLAPKLSRKAEFRTKSTMPRFIKMGSRVSATGGVEFCLFHLPPAMKSSVDYEEWTHWESLDILQWFNSSWSIGHPPHVPIALRYVRRDRNWWDNQGQWVSGWNEWWAQCGNQGWIQKLSVAGDKRGLAGQSISPAVLHIKAVSVRRSQSACCTYIRW